VNLLDDYFETVRKVVSANARMDGHRGREGHPVHYIGPFYMRF